MKRVFLYLFLAISCTEVYPVDDISSDKKYLVVEAYITDSPMLQTVKLTESLPFSGKDEIHPVSGATVTVSDGDEEVIFIESGLDSGLYSAPDSFCGCEGKTYTLSIITKEGKEYKSTSAMGSFGFEIEKIDYMYSPSFSENTWTIGVWGHNGSGNYYLISTAVNGETSPMDQSTVLNDKYFSDIDLYGYPIAYLSQSWDKVKIYGTSAKPLETGDVVSLVCYDIPEDYYEFSVAYSNSVASVSIPILSSPPANVPCNISGENVLGYFVACPVRIFSCEVTDPYKSTFSK